MGFAVTHLAYSDESHHNKGRYRAIAVVTAPTRVALQAATEMRQILTDANVRELKWEKMRTAKDRLAALHVTEWLFGKLDVLRADVLTWDTEDSRHKVPRRDDTANLEIMYHHLFRNVLRMRWQRDCLWRLLPDEQDSMDWQHMHDILDRVSLRADTQRHFDEADRFTLSLRRNYRIIQILPSQSLGEPLIQLADLLAGMAAFSRLHFQRFRTWQDQQTGQGTLIEIHNGVLTRGEEEKCAVLSDFYSRCRKHRLPISLPSSKGLHTRNPKISLNFWPYVPQRPDDKAPSRPLIANSTDPTQVETRRV